MNSDDKTRLHESVRIELEHEIDDYLQEKERIRDIVGRIGGVPRKRERIINIVFLTLVGICFLAAIFMQDTKNLPLELAILLVSLKLIYVVAQNARMHHSEFWMLSTIEWRLNDIDKKIRRLGRTIGHDQAAKDEEDDE
jgi:hypothetical protein